MGYDYRTLSTNQVWSVSPLSRTVYDIRETVLAYLARVSASKLILSVPYYSRAWSTNSDDFHATNISGTKYGASTTVVYSTAIDYFADHGRHYDATEGLRGPPTSARTAPIPTLMSYTLTRSARATLEILLGSTVVRTVYRDRSLASGTYGWTWDGRNAAGDYVSRGSYTLRLTATSTISTTVVNQSPWSMRSARCSRESAEPRQKLPHRCPSTAAAARDLAQRPSLPPPSPYRVTFTIASGAPGTARISVVGTDTNGGTNRSFATVAIQ